ncbi:hypothetical protein F5141DRAFT_1140600 [Pisolithus sp. B1]|nr:hypothetical protein F5141DRAFT_1140600 [Pisolithus sp. B1]
MSNTYVLLQFGSDPFAFRFEDLEGRPAFTVYQNPSVVKVTREAEWSQQHPDIMGPASAFLYFGPANARGYMQISMSNHLRQKREKQLVQCSSRYFTTRTGKELKWKVSPQRMECVDGRSTVAAWELSQPEDVFSARLVLKHSALTYVTELLTTLILNRMALALNWDA